MPEVNDRSRNTFVEARQSNLQLGEKPAQPARPVAGSGDIRLTGNELPRGLATNMREGGYDFPNILKNAAIGGVTMASTFGFLGALNNLTRGAGNSMAVRIFGSIAPVIAGIGSACIETGLEQAFDVVPTAPPDGGLKANVTGIGYHMILPSCFMAANYSYALSNLPKKFPINKRQGFMLAVGVSALGSSFGKGGMEAFGQYEHKKLVQAPGSVKNKVVLVPPGTSKKSPEAANTQPSNRPGDISYPPGSAAPGGPTKPATGYIAVARGLTQVPAFALNVWAARAFQNGAVPRWVLLVYPAMIGFPYMTRGLATAFVATHADSSGKSRNPPDDPARHSWVIDSDLPPT